MLKVFRSLQVALASTLLLSGCPGSEPRLDIHSIRYQVRDANGFGCVENLKTKPIDSNCENVTPEIERGPDGKETYEMHVVEFDDQGWLYPNRAATSTHPAANPMFQIENVMRRLRQLLDDKQDLSIVVFVHGWKHDAAFDDGNVKIFRALLRNLTAQENAAQPRKVVGIYVAWRGATWPGQSSGEVMDLSFWGREGAMTRVAEGAARELFARLYAMRRYYNNPMHARENDVSKQQQEQPMRRPRIRTLMIGHSFGAGILFTLTLGQLIQVLSAQTDLPPGSGEGVDSQERVADLIVLINPAIEAIPYDALFTVSNRYRPNTYQPPLLVSITSTGDDATGIAFPVGRAVYTLFERPTSSPLQSEALDHTFGHMGHYITHRLSRGKRAAVCPDWTPPPTDKDAQGDNRPGGNVSDIAFAAAIAAPNKIPES